MPSKSERSDDAKIYDLVRSLDEVAEFVSGLTHADFLHSNLHRAGVAMALQAAGEYASQLSEDARSKLPEIEWRKIIAFRNRVAHGYFQLNPDRVWLIATEYAPELRASVAPLLRPETDD